jgi:quinol monooxygenase YgiN
MVLSLVRITPNQHRWREVEDILISVAGPTMAERGCGRCEVLRGVRDESIVLLEEWETESDLLRHIRSSMYSRVLAAVEFSQAPPEISFYTVADKRGLDLIQDYRAIA